MLEIVKSSWGREESIKWKGKWGSGKASVCPYSLSFLDVSVVSSWHSGLSLSCQGTPWRKSRSCWSSKKKA